MLILPLIEYYNDSWDKQNMTHLRGSDGLPYCGVKPPADGRCGEEITEGDISELQCGRCKRALIAKLKA